MNHPECDFISYKEYQEIKDTLLNDAKALCRANKYWCVCVAIKTVRNTYMVNLDKGYLFTADSETEYIHTLEDWNFDGALVITVYLRDLNNANASKRSFTKYPSNYVKANQKILAYVTDEEDRAWGLLDAWFEREWGEIPYNESARQILIDEFPWDYNVSDDGSDWEEGTGAVVLDLKDHEVSYRVFEDDMREKVVKYSSLDELIKDFIQPLHDGTITSENLRERCEDYLS